MFVKTLKSKNWIKKTIDDGKSCISYLNKLVDQYNNIYDPSIGKKYISADYSALTEKIETNLKASKFKVNDRVGITEYKNIFYKIYAENCSREIVIIHTVLKANPWIYEIKDLKGEKIIEKNCCWVSYKWVIIQNQTVISEIKSK